MKALILSSLKCSYRIWIPESFFRLSGVCSPCTSVMFLFREDLFLYSCLTSSEVKRTEEPRPLSCKPLTLPGPWKTFTNVLRGATKSYHQGPNIKCPKNATFPVFTLGKWVKGLGWTSVSCPGVLQVYKYLGKEIPHVKKTAGQLEAGSLRLPSKVIH